MAAAFSIRGYAGSMRGAAEWGRGLLGFRAEDLPPMEARRFRWWEDEVAAAREAAGEREPAAAAEERSPGRGRAPKERSLSDLIAAAPPVDVPGGGGAAEAEAEADEDEPLRAIMRRAVERKRKRRLEEAAAASAAAAAAEEQAAAGAGGRDEEGNFARKKGLSKESQSEHFKKAKIPSFKAKKQGNLKTLQKGNKLKAGKQRDLKKMLPLHSILKKYTKRTVKLIKEKRVRSKGSGVIELRQKMVKCVKVSDANGILGSQKETSKTPQLESLSQLVSDSLTTSSSSFTDTTLEGDKHVFAESSSSHSSKAKKAYENTNQEKSCELSKTGLCSGLFDLNQALPESADFSCMPVSNSEVSYVDHTQGGTCSSDQQVFENGRKKQKELTFDHSGLESQQPSSELDTSRTKGGPMDLNYGVSQLSAAGEAPLRPATAQTVRLMGKDLTVFDKGDYLAETTQQGTSPIGEHITTQMVLELPRQGQPFLSLQAQSIPAVPANSASTDLNHFSYRTAHDLSHPFPTANVFSGDRSPYENRLGDVSISQSRENVLSGCPPLPNHSTGAFRQDSLAPWHHYSYDSTRNGSSSAPFLPSITRTQSSDYHVNLPQPYGAYSAISVHPHNSASSPWSYPDRMVQGVSDGRAPAGITSRNVDAGIARAVPDYSDASPSSRFVLRSGPVKLSAGAKHILMPSENTGDDNSAPVYSRVSFGSRNENSSAPQNKGAGFHRL
ncbi:hypothetical protein ACP4OV_031394 [Aristida adscensionis]